jgi:predicted RNase H-like HicB family nuclease
MGNVDKDVHDFAFSVYWDVYEGMWAAECVSIKIHNGYLRDLGNTPEEAVRNFMYLLELYLKLDSQNLPCLENPEKK